MLERRPFPFLCCVTQQNKNQGSVNRGNHHHFCCGSKPTGTLSITVGSIRHNGKEDRADPVLRPCLSHIINGLIH